jgi:hypothetical protein
VRLDGPANKADALASARPKSRGPNYRDQTGEGEGGASISPRCLTNHDARAWIGKVACSLANPYRANYDCEYPENQQRDFYRSHYSSRPHGDTEVNKSRSDSTLMIIDLCRLDLWKFTREKYTNFHHQ